MTTKTEISLLALLADIREACGDRGQRMQPELVEHIRGLAVDAARFRFANDSEEDFAICYWDETMGYSGEWMCNGSKGHSVEVLDRAIETARAKQGGVA